jgi:hypothetical protein
VFKEIIVLREEIILLRERERERDQLLIRRKCVWSVAH